MAVRKVPRTDDSSIKSYSTIPAEDPPGGGGGGINVTEHADIGIDLQTRLSLAGDSTPVDIGMEVGIGPLAVATPVELGLTLTDRISGTTRDGVDLGLDLQSVMTLQGQSTPVDAGARIEAVFLDLLRLSGADAVAEEAVAGRTDWVNDGNATGKHNGSSATIAGAALGVRGGRLVLDYASFTNKAFMVIDSVNLHFYTNQAGTVANNGDLKHQWRRVSTDAWTTLATFTGNQDSMSTPATYDITSSIGSWQDLETIQAGVSFESGAAELQTAACDAVEIEITAHLYFDPMDVPGLVAWYRADRRAAAQNDNTAVTAWVNAQGNAALNLAQGTASKQPTLQLNEINGHPVIRGDGGDFLTVLTTALVGTAGSIFVVYKPSNVTGNRTLVLAADEASTTRFCGLLTSGTTLMVTQRNNDTQDAIASATTTLAIGTTYILEVHSNGSAWELVINGVTQSLTTVLGSNTGDWFGDTSALDNLTVGASKSSAESQFFLGDLAEVLVYDGVTLTDQQKSDIRELYLADKYGVTV